VADYVAAMEADGKTAEEISASIAAVLDLAEEVEVDPDAEGVAISPSQLMCMDTSVDPTCLLGNRFLCQGGALVINGPSGIGKSAYVMQGVISFALGQSLFGLTPKRPLRSLIIQAENDIGDLAEQYQGVVRGIGMESRTAELDRMIHIVPESRVAGKAAIDAFARLLERYKPDLFWIDPLMAYLGGDVSSQEVCSAFLRTGLTPLAHQYQCGIIMVHHMGKQSKDKTKGFDSSYSGIGSSEITNWARGVIQLKKLEDGLVELEYAKRGRRVGLADDNGIPTTTTIIEHGQRGICWVASTRADAQTKAAEKVASEAKELEEAIIGEIGKEPSRTPTDCVGIIQRLTGKSSRTSWRLFDRLKMNPRMAYSAGRWTAQCY
jgi:hypothetical protein